MKPFLRAWFAAFLAVPGVATQEATAADVVTLDLPTEWVVGERYALVLEKERTKRDGHEVTRQGASRTRVAVEVLERHVEGYRVAWTWGEVTLDEESRTRVGAGLAQRLAALNDGVRLELELDRFGSVLRLANVDEVVAHYGRVLEVLDAELEADGLDDARRSRALQAVQQLLDPDVVAVTAIQDATSFFAMCGGSFALGAKVELDDRLANPLGGPPIPAKVVVELVDLNAAEERATVTMTSTVDPAKAAISTMAVMQQLAAERGAPAPSPEDVPSLELEDSSRWTFDTRTGWPTTFRLERRSRIGTVEEVSTSAYTVERLAPAAGR